jgi:hypothetical protein
MPFAPKIRKDILAALDDYIIPALRRDVVTQLIAEAPFDFADVEHRVLQKAFLADKELAPFPTILDWKRQRVMAMRFSRFMVIFKGTCIERAGITRQTARQLQRHSFHLLGRCAVRLQIGPPFRWRQYGVCRWTCQMVEEFRSGGASQKMHDRRV